MKSRKYSKTRRAEQEDETRTRIVEAIVALHEELGAANTSIKAVAEKAGVQRLTVYRHFPDDASMFRACTSHWLALNPPPERAEWIDIEDADQQTYTALLAIYRYYRTTETMLANAYCDIEKIETLKHAMSGFEAFLNQVRDDLLGSWKTKGKIKKQLALTLRHCLRFTNWRPLKREGLNDKQITELVMTWIHGSIY